MTVKNRKFWAYVSQTTHQWIHLVLNYIGPINGQGIQAFKDGTPIKNRGEGVSDHTVGDGPVVVVRLYQQLLLPCWDGWTHLLQQGSAGRGSEGVAQFVPVKGKMNMIKFWLILSHFRDRVIYIKVPNHIMYFNYVVCFPFTILWKSLNSMNLSEMNH